MKTRGHKTRDSQRSKVYKWEKYLLDITSLEPLSEYDSIALVEKLWSTYRLDCPPSVYFPDHGKVARGGRTKISLPPWARNELIVAHETTHSLTDKPEIAWHGPEFVGLISEMLVKCLGWSPNLICDTTKMFNLEMV